MSKYGEDFGQGAFASHAKSVFGGSISVAIKLDDNISRLFDKAGLRSVYAVAKAMDEVGNKTKTQVIRSVARQAGVKVGKARGVIRSRQAMGAGNGQYEIIARDVTLSLKEFAPKQTAKGVSAAPWKKRRVFPHTFVGPNKHIFVRGMSGDRRAGRLPIFKLFGPNIPKEMVKDEAEATFYQTAQALLPAAVEKWLMRNVT